ncbi:family 16 glycoside hydrolase [Streptomyces sp. NPDC026673]|uniref:family 16 glycoside hydrolase n=1 Tax=Streptomyces sp. NPDC026673 TaxID=3155724 RepID=UPI0033EF7660
MTTVLGSTPPRPLRPPRRRGPRRAGPVLALLLLVGAVVYAGGERGGAGPGWTDGTVHGRWLSVYDGYGDNRGDATTLRLSPGTASRPDVTHAGLVVSTEKYGDMVYTARMRTHRQLRTPRPNPWEVPWLVWAYTDPEHFSYVALKPNGWELGKRDPAYPGGQRFLATGPTPFPTGHWYRVEVEQRGPGVTIRVDGRFLTSFTDTERPYTRGSVGAYTEDAAVEFRELTVRRPPPVG